MNILTVNTRRVRSLLDRMVSALRIRYCNHVFKGPDLQTRDAEGYVTWPCSKQCGLVWRGTCGIDAPGKILGPWGTVNKANRNQCDGCRQGLQLINGLHRTADNKPFMACTAHLYR